MKVETIETVSQTVIINSRDLRGGRWVPIKIKLELIENPDDPRFANPNLKNGHPDFWVWYADGKEHRVKLSDGTTKVYPVLLLRSLVDTVFPEEGRIKLGYRKYRYSMIG